MREMFDTIAPRYDLVNRIMTFRLDVAVAPPDRPTPSACPPARRCSTSPPAPATSASSCAGAAFRPVSVDLSFGMLAADRSGAPRVQADVLRLPVPDACVDGVTCGFALRNLVGPRGLLRRAGPGRAPRRPHRPARGGHAAEPGAARWGHGLYFGKVVPVHRWPAVRPGRLPLPAEERRLPARARTRCSRRSAQPGSPTSTSDCCRAASPSSLTGDPADVTGGATRTVVDSSATSTSTRVAGGDGYLFVRDGVGLAGRGVAARVAVADAAEVLADDRARRRGRSAGHRAGRLRRAAVPARARPASSSCPRSSSGKDPDGTPVDHARSTAPTPTSRRLRRPARRRWRRLHVAPGLRPRRLPGGRRRRPRRGPGRAARQGRARPRRRGRGRAADRRARRPAAACGHVRVELPLLGRRLRRRQPRAARGRHGDVVRSHPLAGTTPRTGDPARRRPARRRS